MYEIIKASRIEVFDNIALELQGITECEGDWCYPSISERRKVALQGGIDAISAVEGV